jgi:hypothetical protein
MNDRNAALSRQFFKALILNTTEPLYEEMTAIAGFHITTARLVR